MGTKVGSLEFSWDILLSSIRISDTNVRKTKVTDGLAELAKSIQTVGLIEPIKVSLLKKEKDSYKYELREGQRRFLAMRDILNWETSPKTIIEEMEEDDWEITSFISNIMRIGLPRKDRVNFMAKEAEKHNWNLQSVAEKIGLKEEAVGEYLGIHALPTELKKLHIEGGVGKREVLNLKDKLGIEKATEIAQEVIGLPKKERTKATKLAAKSPELPLEQILKVSEEPIEKMVDMPIPIDFADRLNKAAKAGKLSSAGDVNILHHTIILRWLQDNEF